MVGQVVMKVRWRVGVGLVEGWWRVGAGLVVGCWRVGGEMVESWAAETRSDNGAHNHYVV